MIALLLIGGLLLGFWGKDLLAQKSILTKPASATFVLIGVALTIIGFSRL